MPARHKVDQLPGDQLKFVLDHIIEGETDREICLTFEDTYGTKLSKSSLARWRKAAGDELADRYRMTRYQATQLIEDMKLDPDSDKYAVVMASIEDRLLTATREVVSQDPFKLIIIQQEEKRRKLKEQELRLKEKALELEREKVHGVALNRVKLGEEFSSDLLDYIGADAEGLTWFRKHAKNFIQYLSDKYAEAKA